MNSPPGCVWDQAACRNSGSFSQPLKSALWSDNRNLISFVRLRDQACQFRNQQSRTVVKFGDHGSIWDSWPIAFSGCPRGSKVGWETGCLCRLGVGFHDNRCGDSGSTRQLIAPRPTSFVSIPVSLWSVILSSCALSPLQKLSHLPRSRRLIRR
jgi:hypothetical protein